MTLSSPRFLHELRLRGATRLRSIRFRTNRSTIWSLTAHGTVLNVHEAFRDAPPGILDAFALLAREWGVASPEGRRAAERIRSWPPLESAMQEARHRHARRKRAARQPSHCAGSAEQRAYLRALYRYLNHTRFEGGLPEELPVRWSRRMRSALGHMRPGESPDGERYVAEIALNIDLLLPGNGAERVDTLLHEMAHAADYLESGSRGHGRSWRAWARRVGCRPTTLYDRPVTFRRNREARVDRVPPLPVPLHHQAGHSHPKAPAVSRA